MRKTLWIAAALAAPAALFFFDHSSAAAQTGDPLLDGFTKVAIASVSDAVDQVTGQRGFLSHSMRPRIEGKLVPQRFVGRARTSVLRQANPDQATAALSARHTVEMIDNAAPGEVGVIVVEGSLDVAGAGGLMATAAKSRGMAGLVIDGAIRDVGEIRGLGLPVFARSVSPSSSVGRWATVANQQPVECAGVTIRPGDILVAGEDGVVRVPADRAEDVLKRAREIDERETKMVPFIKKEKSLSKVVAIFNRI
ncbi:MAG: RraA family protein [Bryobacteraceae bacterium]|nr:RraA family protein [Bryobacteraceae bacterium]